MPFRHQQTQGKRDAVSTDFPEPMVVTRAGAQPPPEFPFAIAVSTASPVTYKFPIDSATPGAEPVF